MMIPLGKTAALAALKRIPWRLVLVGIAGLAAAGFLGWQLVKVANLRADLVAAEADRDKARADVKAERDRADQAEKAIADLRDAWDRAEAATRADGDRARRLEAQLARQKGRIDEMEARLGATPVSPLTAEHLAGVRERQLGRVAGAENQAAGSAANLPR